MLLLQNRKLNENKWLIIKVHVRVYPRFEIVVWTKQAKIFIEHIAYTLL